MREVQLGTLVRRTLGGGTPSRAVADYWMPEIPWASVKDVSSGGKNLSTTEEGISRHGLQASASNLIEAGTPILAMRMAVGSVATFAKDVAINQDLRALIPIDGVDRGYLFYVLESLSQKVSSLGVGSTVKGIRVDQLLKIPVPAPPGLAEQRRIADLLSAVDEQIELCDEQTSKLKALRSGVVFERLLPLADTSPSYSLGALCAQVTSGSRGWASYYSNKGALFLRIGNLTREHPNLRFDDVVRVQVPEGGEGARTRLKEGDLLISITADLGIVASVPPGLGEAYVNQHIALARLSDQRVHPRWVAHALASPFGSNQIARLNDGGAKAGLNLPTIRALRVPLPDWGQQLRVVELIDSIDAQLEKEQAHLAKLKLQKQGLLSKLLTPPAQRQTTIVKHEQ